MITRPYGNTGVELSAIGLGGHEFLPDGSSRGFNEDRGDAIRPGYTGKGYGGPNRIGLLKLAFESGINFLDVTIDPEQEALGRNLRDVPPPYDVYIQTRPQGMGYSYDPGNRKMTDFGLLKAEVERILTLLQREQLEILNVPFMQEALDEDPEYLDKIGENVDRLKGEGLIRFASADTNSGEATYLAQIGSGAFDSVSMNLNLADCAAREKVLPAAAAAGMGVITREVFMKGRLFRYGEWAGITDRDLLCRASLTWNLSVPEVTTVLVGAQDKGQLTNALSALETDSEDPAISAALDSVEAEEACTDAREQRAKGFQHAT